MEKLKADLAAARTKLDAQEEPARRVKALENQLKEAQRQVDAERNLASVKAARRELADLLEEIKEAESTMLQACRVAFTCWKNLQAMGRKVIPLRGHAMAESTPVPNVPCPIDPATLTRLKL